MSEEIAGHAAVARSAGQQLALIREERPGLQGLVARNLVTKPRLLALERSEADLDGKRGAAQAQTARARQTIAEAQVAKLNVRNDAAREVATELRDVQGKLHQLSEKIEDANDVMSRTWVRAPLAGTVTDLRLHTIGGIISRGDPILDIVPSEDDVLIEAQLRPEDIAAVRVGQTAQVHLLPYKQRRTPPPSGTVIHIAADRLIDRATNRPYFSVNIRMSSIPPEIKPQPGMPCDVMIQTGESTVAAYALAPLLDSMGRAFRER